MPSGTAPGYRHYISGEPGGVGYYGYSWASTTSGVSGANGMGLGFCVTWLSPSGAYGRSHGFQLRCLSE